MRGTCVAASAAGALRLLAALLRAHGFGWRVQVTPVFHFPFVDGKQSEAELANIVRNVTLFGALLYMRGSRFMRPKYD